MGGQIRWGPVTVFVQAMLAALVWFYSVAGWPLVLGVVAVWARIGWRSIVAERAIGGR